MVCAEKLWKLLVAERVYTISAASLRQCVAESFKWSPMVAEKDIFCVDKRLMCERIESVRKRQPYLDIVGQLQAGPKKDANYIVYMHMVG